MYSREVFQNSTVRFFGHSFALAFKSKGKTHIYEVNLIPFRMGLCLTSPCSNAFRRHLLCHLTRFTIKDEKPLSS